MPLEVTVKCVYFNCIKSLFSSVNTLVYFYKSGKLILTINVNFLNFTAKEKSDLLRLCMCVWACSCVCTWMWRLQTTELQDPSVCASLVLGLYMHLDFYVGVGIQTQVLMSHLSSPEDWILFSRFMFQREICKCRQNHSLKKVTDSIKSNQLLENIQILSSSFGLF